MPIEVKFDSLADIFLLKTGARQTVVIYGMENISLVYADAYGLDIYVEVTPNPPLKSLTVTRIDKPKPKDIGKLLVHALIAGDEERVSYSGVTGTVDLPSARTAVYNCARSLGIRVRVHESMGLLFVETYENNSAIETILEQFEVNETKKLPLSLHTSLERLRTSISNYSRKNNVSFKTRLSGKELLVTRVPLKDKITAVTGMNEYRHWLKTSPWDVALPIPRVEDITEQHLVVTAKRILGCCVSFRGGVVTKRSFAKGIEGGARVVRVRGMVVYSAFCDRFNAEDIEAINDILSYHNKSYEDL